VRKAWIWAGILVLGACSGATDERGPSKPPPGSLGMRARAGTMCLPLKSHRQLVVGWETLHNEAPTPVTVTSVDVARAHDVLVDQAWLVDIPDGPFTIVGTWAGEHPHYDPHTRRLMGRARPAEGAQIAGSSTVNLVLQLSTTAGGRSGPAEVIYTDADGSPHYWQGGSSIVLKAGPTC
jgi:hypothetical protein